MRPFAPFFRLFSFFLILSRLIINSQAEEQKLHQLIEKGKSEIYHFRLAEATHTFRQIQNEFSGLPHGYFYEAFIMAIYYSQDRTNSALDSALQRTIRVAIAKGEVYRQQGNQPAEAAYYLGISHGVLGIYHVLNSSYFKGYLHGRNAKNYLEETIKIDSTYYDAYLGLGIFHYYTDLLPGIVKFFANILGFRGDRILGIREIQYTASKGKYFKIEAEFTYAAIRYFLEGMYSNSLRTFLRLNTLYPENPALLLLIGYHYRRFGQIEKAEKYFQSVSESFLEKLPQIIVMKYYNLGVCYYRLNDFDTAEKCFNRLMDKNLRKSQYYQAAIAFYKGMLAGLKFDQASADYYFGLIRYNQETQYWYHISRIYSKTPFDKTMRDYIIAENHAYTFQTALAMRETEALMKSLSENQSTILNRDFIFLVKDLEARLAFQQGQVQKSKQLFESFITELPKYEDEFQRAWIYIGYARVLRELEEWEGALKALKKAEATNDEYTRLIIEREKFILKKSQLNLRS